MTTALALSVDAILADETLRQQLFPATERCVFAAHAAVAPLPGPVAEAMVAYTQAACREGQFEHLHESCESDVRLLAARMMDVDADEVALVPSTSAGLSMVAAGLDWRAGDSVVACGGDFPSNVYPWTALRERGVDVRLVPPHPEGVIKVEDVLRRVDASTRVVALSTVHFCTGAQLPLDDLAAELRPRGVLLVLDAIQSLGALPLSFRHADAAVADGHKWLLGPQGIGVLYVRRSMWPLLRPALIGWKSVEDCRSYCCEQELARSARRYEPGSLNAVGLVGLHAALRLLAEAGAEAVAGRLAALRRLLVDALSARGLRVLAGAEESASPIVAFSGPRPAGEVCRYLNERGFKVSMRTDPAGRPCVRLSPHFYNTDGEMERLCDCIEAAEGI